MSDFSRRKVLKAAPLVVGAGALLEGCQLPKLHDPYLRSQHKQPVPGSEVPKGTEAKLISICGQCQAGCALTARVVEGRAVKLDGQPDYPVNLGSLGPKGQSGTGMLYHRDRLKGPMKRDGERGSGKYKQVRWTEAIAEIGEQLRALREKGEARGLVVIDGLARGPMHELWARFAQAFGTPNLVDHRSVTDGAKGLASLYTQGVNEVPAYDWARVRYVMGLGPGHLESWCQTIHMMRTESDLRHGVAGKRVKFVSVSSRFAQTALKADEWIPIQAGGYAAFVLGLCHVLVRDGLYDQKWVAEQSFGFEDFKDKDGKPHRGFKDVVMKEGDPKVVGPAVGVKPEEIERLAREMVDLGPAVVLSDGRVGSATNGLYTELALQALNALLGNIGRPGGMWVQQRAPLSAWKTVVPDEAAGKGHHEPRLDGAGTVKRPLADGAVYALPEAIISGQPYAAGAVLLHYSNPLFAKPGGKQWLEALSKVPLVVSFSPYADETTWIADYVLPDCSYLERWELVEPAPFSGPAAIGLRQPVVKPLLDSWPTGNAVIALAKAVGGPVAEAFPWETYEDALKERLEGLLKVEGANVSGDDVDALVEAMAEQGGWWKKALPEQAWYSTPSGKFEFYSQLAAQKLAALPAVELEAHLAKTGVRARGDLLCLPHVETANFVGDEKEFPFLLFPYRAINYAEGGVRHLKRLTQLPVTRVGIGKERVELAPVDAERLGVKNGEKVVVETPAGAREVIAEVKPDARPGSLGFPLGYGEWPPKAGELTGGYQLLDPAAEDPVGGVFAVIGIRARVRRAGS